MGASNARRQSHRTGAAELHSGAARAAICLRGPRAGSRAAGPGELRFVPTSGAASCSRGRWDFSGALPDRRLVPSGGTGHHPRGDAIDVLKPSERTPLGAARLAELFLEAGFPDGVLNVVHGAAEVVTALLEHPGVSAVSFVGSEPVARHVYRTAAQHGKRVQALGGAKNHLVVMPDVDIDVAAPAILNSAFGNAGERCLAGSVAVMVGEASRTFVEPLVERASRLTVGPGDQAGVDVGPMIRPDHRDRVSGYVAKGEAEGADVLLDGRPLASRQGWFLGPTILANVTDRMAVGRDEIFGPVLSVARAETLEAAIEQANRSALGNMAVIFTSSGRSGREFRERVQAGMVGVNVPIAQPFAFYPFSGWKGSFYGDLHVHGTDGVEFTTRK